MECFRNFSAHRLTQVSSCLSKVLRLKLSTQSVKHLSTKELYILRLVKGLKKQKHQTSCFKENTNKSLNCKSEKIIDRHHVERKAMRRPQCSTLNVISLLSKLFWGKATLKTCNYKFILFTLHIHTAIDFQMIQNYSAKLHCILVQCCKHKKNKHDF